MTGLDRFHRRLVKKGARNSVERLLLCCLVPLSVIYGLVGWIRGKCYDLGLLGTYRAEVPVVSVGNLAAGGTGKTPVVDRLLKEFLRQGKRPAVVSRGYGGSFAGEVGIVCAGAGPLLSAAVAGDEPYLLARRNPQALVLVARSRVAGVKSAVAEHAADLIILDDGFQHRAVARDVDLVLLDAERPFGNGLALPAGILRELPGALKRADLLLLTRSESQTDTDCFDKPTWKSRHRLADYALDLTAEQVPLAQLKQKKLFTFAGVADPDGFFQAAAELGLTIGGHLPLSDHVDYDSHILGRIRAAAAGCDGLLTTEKDGVKLSPEMFDLPCYQLPLRVQIDAERELIDAITQRLWRQ